MLKLYFKIIIILIFFQLGSKAQINFQNYNGKIATNKPQLIVFFASWCGSCKKFEKNVLQDKEISAFINENYNAYSVDVDKDKSDISRKYDVSGLPTIVFVSEKGELLYKGVGYVDAEEFLKKGKFALKKGAGKLTDTDRLYECMESEMTKNCEELLKKYLENGSWEKDEISAVAVIDYALNGNKTALNHLLQNKDDYSNVISNDLMDRAMLMLAQEEMKQLLVNAFEKKSEPDWKKIEQILKKYVRPDNYITEFSGIRGAYFYELGNWSKFLNSKNEYIKSIANKKTNEDKGIFIFNESISLIEDIDNYEKKFSTAEEKQNAELIYSLLTEAEGLMSNPSADLYYELSNAAETLGLKEEDYFYSIYAKIKNGLNAKDAKKSVIKEIKEEEEEEEKEED
jgi:thioredoxin-related protein